MSSLFLLGFLLFPAFSRAQTIVADPLPNQDQCVNIVNNLRYRDRDIYKNGEVSILQDFLQTQNYLNNEPTGYFGLLTFKAVKDFQRSNGISPTGYVGATTRAKIANITCNGVSQEEVCCEIFGYGAYMIKTQSTYEMMPRNKCIPVTNYVGGGRNIVDNNYCKMNSPTPVTVISPNGGEMFYKGNYQTISWKDNTTYSCPNMALCLPPALQYDITLLHYTPPCVSNYCPLAVMAPYTIARGVFGSSYNWQVGSVMQDGSIVSDISSGLYKISICKSGTSECDTSDSPFTIQ